MRVTVCCGVSVCTAIRWGVPSVHEIREKQQQQRQQRVKGGRGGRGRGNEEEQSSRAEKEHETVRGRRRKSQWTKMSNSMSKCDTTNKKADARVEGTNKDSDRDIDDASPGVGVGVGVGVDSSMPDPDWGVSNVPGMIELEVAICITYPYDSSMLDDGNNSNSWAETARSAASGASGSNQRGGGGATGLHGHGLKAGVIGLKALTGFMKGLGKGRGRGRGRGNDGERRARAAFASMVSQCCQHLAVHPSWALDRVVPGAPLSAAEDAAAYNGTTTSASAAALFAQTTRPKTQSKWSHFDKYSHMNGVGDLATAATAIGIGSVKGNRISQVPILKVRSLQASKMGAEAEAVKERYDESREQQEKRLKALDLATRRQGESRRLKEVEVEADVRRYGGLWHCVRGKGAEHRAGYSAEQLRRDDAAYTRLEQVRTGTGSDLTNLT
jgi:hypothetical protein